MARTTTQPTNSMCSQRLAGWLALKAITEFAPIIDVMGLNLRNWSKYSVTLVHLLGGALFDYKASGSQGDFNSEHS